MPKISFLSILLATAAAFPVKAQVNCEVLPDCAALGFSQTDDANCADDGYLYCPFDESYKKCIQPSCEALGFTTDDKSSWCGNIVTCLTDSSYTLCSESKTLCPEGFTENLTSVADCGSGSHPEGWKVETTIVSNSLGGTVTCGRCIAKDCAGYNAEYASVNDCGNGSHPSGWKYEGCYSGDTPMGKCTAKTCSDYGARKSSSGCEVWKTLTVYNGDSSMTCYECRACIGQGGIAACLEKYNGKTCTWACNNNMEKPSGYPYGQCTGKGYWKCCSSGSKPSGYSSSDLFEC